MAKRRKKTALQRRRERERERDIRTAYQAGKIAPAQPKGKAARRKAAEQARQSQIKAGAYKRRSSAEVAQMNKADLITDAMRLWDDAYNKYRALRESGISNAATSMYEQQFAGMDIYSKNVNELRAIIAQLKHWLSRKDTRVTRAKRAKKKMMQGVFADMPDITEDEISDFWHNFALFKEQYGGTFGIMSKKRHGGSPPSVFAQAVKIARENPNMTAQQIFQTAYERMRTEYEQYYKEFDFGESPLGL